MADTPSWYKPAGATPDWYSPPAVPEAPPKRTGSIGEGIGEAALSMASGALAKPASDVAGLAALAKEIISPTPGGGDPAGFKREVQDALTYEPKTQRGDQVARYNPIALLGRGVDWLGGKAEDAIRPPPGQALSPARAGVASGVHEAINQAPGLLGSRFGGPAARATGDAAQEAGRGLMQSALKPPLQALRRGDAGRAIDTMLDQGINVSKGGVARLSDRIGQLNDEIDKRVASSRLSVNKQRVADSLHDTLADFMRQVDSKADVAAIQKVYDNFMDNPLAPLGRHTIPVPLAQEMKRGTYRQLKGKYGELSSADMEAQKALARGLKEEIARAIPEIKPLNAEESKLLNALPLVERRVLMSANKNPVGLGILAGSPEKLAGWMADRSDLFKSIVARMLYKGGAAAGGAGPALQAGGVGTSAAAGRLPQPPGQQ